MFGEKNGHTIIKSKTQELENCEEKIREALKATDEALKECGLKISDVKLSSLEKDNMVKPLGAVCLIWNGWGICLVW